MQSHRLAPLLLATLTTLATAAPPASHPTTLPFSISRNTTAITSPLRPDGRPDYLAAINQKNSKDVTPENNALPLLLQIFGPDFIKPESREKALTLAGITLPVSTSPLFQDIAHYVNDAKTPLTTVALTAQRNEFTRPWPALDQSGEVAKYIHSQDAALDLAVEASKRPRLFVPCASSNGTLFDALSVSLTGHMDLARNLYNRALLQASAGNWDNALSDALALKRLGRLFAQEGLGISLLEGLALDNIGTESLGILTASGKLSLAQCTALAKSLDLPPFQSIADCYNNAERWYALDQWLPVATGDKAALAKLDPADKENLAGIDWNLALTIFNTEYDRTITIYRRPTCEAIKLAAAAFKAEQEKWTLEPRGPQAPGESHADFTKRVVHQFLVTQDTQKIAQFEILSRQVAMRHNMLLALLAAATTHARTGQWPASLDHLPPDIYAQDPNSPVSFHATPDHVQLFSVGPDHTPNTPDDLIVGF